MNLCEQLRIKLGAAGLRAVAQDSALNQHAQACVHCQSLLQAYAALPKLLDALPEYEPDPKLLELTDARMPFGANKAAHDKPRWRPLAPALAASLVALCTIGIFNQVANHEAPLAAQIPGRASIVPSPGRQLAATSIEASEQEVVFDQNEEQGRGQPLAPGNGDNDDLFLEEIVVTAYKREHSVQDVPVEVDGNAKSNSDDLLLSAVSERRRPAKADLPSFKPRRPEAPPKPLVVSSFEVADPGQLDRIQAGALRISQPQLDVQAPIVSWERQDSSAISSPTNEAAAQRIDLAERQSNNDSVAAIGGNKIADDNVAPGVTAGYGDSLDYYSPKDKKVRPIARHNRPHPSEQGASQQVDYEAQLSALERPVQKLESAMVVADADLADRNRASLPADGAKANARAESMAMVFLSLQQNAPMPPAELNQRVAVVADKYDREPGQSVAKRKASLKDATGAEDPLQANRGNQFGDDKHDSGLIAASSINGRFSASNDDNFPVVKVIPIYPRRAQSRGLKGHVLLEFTVTKTGAVSNPVVIESAPPGVFDRAALAAVIKFKYKPRIVDGLPVAVPSVQNLMHFELPGPSEEQPEPYEPVSVEPTAVDFFDEYANTDGLVYQEPKGYWANTYVPGDPEIRLLRSRLAAWDRSKLGVAGKLEQLIHPLAHPFDSPADNALALSLMADANAVDGPTRMRLQVGIQGIADRLGHRPSLNLGIVVDLPADAADAERIAVRALLDALLKTRQSGDHFSLVFSGGPEQLAVAPGQFRFGPLQVAKQWVFGQRAELPDAGITLYRALEIAAEAVRQNDDPSQPLGSSSIFLISAGDLADIEALSLLAHRQAAAGVLLSVAPLGQRPDLERVDRLVLAGLGNRRLLESPDQARQLVTEELHSASRAVARAVRLSIRLAPGVHLVSVIGAQRLAEPAADRVREIEQSMDRRLSRNLGIAADRGEDEQGIQIVIPSIYAGDSLSVLLDLVVDQAGPVAEVSLRYKDLVFLRNGVLDDQLELPKGALNRGAGELVVLKNLLAHEFAASTRRAAKLLGRQRLDQTVEELGRLHALLTTARAWTPSWRHDFELRRDQQVLARYLKLLGSPATTPEHSLLADSLSYAAWRKSHRE